MDETKKELLANIPPFGLRMQPELKNRLKLAAENNNRSMNAEIIDRLEASFSDEIAHLKGMNDALGRTVRLFIEHLSASEEGRRAVIEAIIKDEFLRKDE